MNKFVLLYKSHKVMFNNRQYAVCTGKLKVRHFAFASAVPHRHMYFLQFGFNLEDAIKVMQDSRRFTELMELASKPWNQISGQYYVCSVDLAKQVLNNDSALAESLYKIDKQFTMLPDKCRDVINRTLYPSI